MNKKSEGYGFIIFLLIAVAIFYFKPDILDSFKTKPIINQNNITQTVIPVKEYLGNPIKDSIEIDCKWDSDCIFHNDRCTDNCRCDAQIGECYILV